MGHMTAKVAVAKAIYAIDRPYDYRVPQELEGRLRAGVTPGEIMSAFVSAAGVLALSMYIQLGDTSDIGSFKAGNMTVNLRGGDSRAVSAASLRRQAELMLAAWLEDRGFDFLGVRG